MPNRLLNRYRLFPRFSQNGNSSTAGDPGSLEISLETKRRRRALCINQALEVRWPRQSRRDKTFFRTDTRRISMMETYTMITTKQRESAGIPVQRLATCSVVLLGLTLASHAVALDRRVFPGDVWETATPESQGVDSAKLNAAISYLKQQAPRDGVRELASSATAV